MSVKPRKGSPFYYFAFEYRGRRFHGSTKKTNRREAEAVERAEREAVKAAIEAQEKAGQSLRLDDVAGRYFQEVGVGKAAEQNICKMIGRLIEFFGPDKLITDITHQDVGRLVAWRRGHRIERGGKIGELVGVFTVNDQTEQLKKLCNWARRQGIHFPLPIVWKDHFLKEPIERVRELQSEEKAALDAAGRDDYADILAFANLTGLRQTECLLRWREVNFETGQIVKTGKNGERVAASIDPVVRAILWRQRGNHPDFVFTYVCRRTLKGRGLVRGQRHPITKEGLKTVWRRQREAAEVEDFRFHDFRHDFATKLLRETGNLKLTSQALNHKRIETTMKYAHVIDSERAAAVAKVRARMAGAENPPKTPPLAAKKLVND